MLQCNHLAAQQQTSVVPVSPQPTPWWLLCPCSCPCPQVREANEKIIREYATMAAEVSRPATSGEEALALKRYIGRCVRGRGVDLPACLEWWGLQNGISLVQARGR